ncbi:glycosyl transferase, family 39 [Pseudogulbenkiania sp. NH8B]|uniref:ArnT family glycosyltransferase n=1 Tax=Pseudogulbenkiania sp. (strain NH8B) TaxID=748280 RepID=UPI0002279B17|nr:glycosyltransferase family 39 protein [Pseudogulbenkiania sp. NH8B]BAK75860.1 glycosyl transferase, family 39 [Pseudogulbenkiania sp. NH8B]
MKPTSRPGWQRQAFYVLLALIVVRLSAMALIPLNDTTEARYAEIARKMLETGNWVTLWHDYQIPFWAKPPLSTWLSAAFMGVFGVNELAARLPALLLSIGTVALTASLAAARSGRDAALACVLVLASGLLFFLAAGTVMTDPALMFSVTLIQTAFWHALAQRSRRWGYLFFVGMGVGLLAKGPVAIVLAAMPIGLWVIVRKQWKPLWQHLPWFGGLVLTLLIAAPWYLLAEHRTPGFLNYFIMGEHVSRFLDPGWKGDRYGFAHATPHGMIWPYTVAALLPWSLAMLPWLVRQRRRLPALCRDQDGWLLYASLWTVMTLLFFSLSGNIIWPYSMPMLPGFALLFAELWQRADLPQRGRWLPALGLVSAVIALAATAAFVLRPEAVGRSQKRLIEAWQHEQPSPDSQLLYWDRRREFSAEFYSAGRARSSTDSARFEALLHNTTRDYIAVDAKEVAELPPAVRAGFEEIGRFRNMKDVTLLLREHQPPRSAAPATEPLRSPT